MPIGRLFGIPVRLHYSWFIIFALMIWAFAAQYYPSAYPHWSTAVSVSAGIITSLIFFVSLLAHELMHSLIAQRNGIPVKAITLFIFGGVSQISDEPADAGIEFRIAIAGPLASIFMGGMFWLLWYILPPAMDVLAAVSFWLGSINITLAIFNLIPGFPLDGGRILRSIIWWRTGSLRRATAIASNIGRGIGFLFILAGIWLAFTAGWSSGLWLGLIGWFLANSASNSRRQMLMQQTLEGHVVSESVHDDCMAVAPDLSIERLVSDYIVPRGRYCFSVVREEITLGLVTLQEVKGVLRDMRARVSVEQIMKPFDKLIQVAPGDSLTSVFSILTQENLNQVPVVVEGKIIGILTRDNLIRFVNQHERKSA